MAGVNSCDASYGPVSHLHGFVLKEDDITWFELATWVEPLASLGDGGQIGGSPPFPQISLQTEYEVPPLEMTEWACGWKFGGQSSGWKFGGQSSDRSAYQKMSGSEKGSLFYFIGMERR